MTEVSRSSVPLQRSVRMRFLLPSVGDLIFVAMLGTLLCTPLSTKLLSDGGIGWHIRTGQIIAQTHVIPRVDSFSSTMSGRPWFAWEWLYDLAVGQLERVAGLNGVVWLTAATIAAVFSLAFWMLVRRGVSLLAALVLVLMAASASMVHFLARPHVISWLFSLVWFRILDRTELDVLHAPPPERRKIERLLWLLPFLMLVWVNVHGGFLVGFVLLGIYWVTAVHASVTLGETRWEDVLVKLRACQRSKQLLVVGLLSLLATYFNPYGWRLYAHIYQYLSNRYLIDHIDEFQSPNFYGAAERCFALLMLIALVALAARVRRLRLSEGLVVLFAVYSGLYAVRNVPVSSLLLILVAGPLLVESMQRFSGRAWFGFLRRMTGVEIDLRGHLWPLAATVALFSVAVNGGNVGSQHLMDAHFGSPRFPVVVVNRLEQGKAWGPILAPDYWGGYLIYRLYPQERVVVDDRHDFYGEDFLRDYVTMIHAERGWQKFLLEHNVCCVLAAKGSALDNVLAQSGEWKEIYSDDVAVAFESGRLQSYRRTVSNLWALENHSRPRTQRSPRSDWGTHRSWLLRR